jgi:hypothetical protein
VTDPHQPPRPLPAAVVERVIASADRTALVQQRAASLAAQVTPITAAPSVARAERQRLLAAHAVAATFYRAQLAGPDGAGPRRYLAARGVPTGGPVPVGYAPDRPTALVNELRRRGFSDTEILASGLAATGRRGALVDRFQGRVMLGVRAPATPTMPVVGFVGLAPPGGDPAVLHSPATAIYRPGEALLGLAEQQAQVRAGARPVIGADPLSVVAAAADPQGPLLLAPCSPALTVGQVATLTAEVDTAAGVVVTVVDGDAGRRAAERAHAVLAPAYQHPARPGPVLATRPDALAETRPLLDAVVTARVDWATRRFPTPEGRAAAARAVRAMLAGLPTETGPPGRIRGGRACTGAGGAGRHGGPHRPTGISPGRGGAEHRRTRPGRPGSRQRARAAGPGFRHACRATSPEHHGPAGGDAGRRAHVPAG